MGPGRSRVESRVALGGVRRGRCGVCSKAVRRVDPTAAVPGMAPCFMAHEMCVSSCVPVAVA
eukprot:1734632-Prymnesium_polylepis.2